MQKIANGTSVECVEHDGAHVATVVADMGFAYGVAWDFENIAANRVHTNDADFMAYDAVRPTNR